jgi:hypothetical protein
MDSVTVPVSSWRRRAVRLAFTAVVALWMLQVPLMGGGAGEPYPSILMPAFAGTGGYRNGMVHLERMEPVFAGPWGERPVSPRALLAEFPVSHQYTLATRLSPVLPEDVPLRTWIRGHLLPSLAASEMDHRPACPHPSMRAWARRRAAALVPGAPVHRLELRWYRDAFLPGHPVPVSREPAGVLTIPLDKEAPCAA